MRKMLSSLMIIVLLISAFSIQGFAATILKPSEMAITWATTGSSGGDYSSTVVVTPNARTEGGYTYTGISNSNPSAYLNGSKVVWLSQEFNFNVSHTYKVDLSASMFSARPCLIQVVVDVINTDGTIKQELLLSEKSLSASDNKADFNFTFNLKDFAVSSGSVRFALWLSVPAGYQSPFSYYVSDITVQDTDDNSSFFDGIIGTIKHIFIAIVGGECSDGDYESDGLFGKISDLGDTIGGFFTSFWNEHLKEPFDDIKQKLSDFKEGIENLPQNIKDKLASLFTTLKNYILYFQDPVTINSDGVPIGADGEPVYENKFITKLNEFKTQVNSWISSIKTFTDSLSTDNTIIQYLDTFKTILNGFTTGIPLLATILGFGMVFVVIRKVVGR